MLITALYRCHDFNVEKFLKVIENLTSTSKNKNHIIVGDFNINILSSESVSENLQNITYSYGFLPMFRTITRPNENGGSCIDNMYVKTDSSFHAIKYSQIFPDHFPLLCAFNCIEAKEKCESYIYKTNFNKLDKVCNRINWEKYETIDDPNTAMESLICDINYCVKKATVRKLKRKLKFRKPWMTTGISVSIEKKEVLFNLWNENKGSLILKNEFKKYNYLLSKIIKKAKTMYEIKKAEKSYKNSKNVWGYFNEKMGKKKSKKRLKKLRRRMLYLRTPRK